MLLSHKKIRILNSTLGQIIFIEEGVPGTRFCGKCVHTYKNMPKLKAGDTCVAQFEGKVLNQIVKV